MTVSPSTGPSLTVIGENIHCTRVALRKGKRIAERERRRGDPLPDRRRRGARASGH